jgi:hypothetical protein
MASLFNTGFGQPTKELHTVLGVLLLQQALDLSDKATIDQLCFNIQCVRVTCCVFHRIHEKGYTEIE